jgi:hypothetical protein
MIDRILYIVFFVFYLICLIVNFDVLYLITVLICAGSFYLMLKVYKKWLPWALDAKGKGKLLAFFVLRL